MIDANLSVMAPNYFNQCCKRVSIIKNQKSIYSLYYTSSDAFSHTQHEGIVCRKFPLEVATFEEHGLGDKVFDIDCKRESLRSCSSMTAWTNHAAEMAWRWHRRLR